MIYKSNADINNLLITDHVLKLLFDPYNAIMDVDAILQIRKIQRGGAFYPRLYSQQLVEYN